MLRSSFHKLFVCRINHMSLSTFEVRFPFWNAQLPLTFQDLMRSRGRKEVRAVMRPPSVWKESTDWIHAQRFFPLSHQRPLLWLFPRMIWSWYSISDFQLWDLFDNFYQSCLGPWFALCIRTSSFYSRWLWGRARYLCYKKLWRTNVALGPLAAPWSVVGGDIDTA